MRTRNFEIERDSAKLVGEQRVGNGVPLVLVHGFGGSRRDWDPLTSALPAAYIISYDQRGFGESSAKPGVAFSHADDLVGILDALDFEQVDICGVSLGGATALGCALQACERVRRLVLVSPMLAGWSWSAEWVERWKAIGRKARAGDIEGARALWWEHPLFDQARESAHADVLKRSIESFHGKQWIHDDQRDEWPMVERLHEVTAPTLLLTGALDQPDFRLMADLIAAAVPSTRRIDYPDAGHMLTVEKPREMAEAIAAFLS